MNKASFLAIAGVALMACASSVRASVIGIDVQGTAYSGPGVLDTSSRTWTSKTATGNTFVLDGQTITVVFGPFSTGGVDAAIDLFDDYKHNGGGGAVGFALTGLDLTKTYNLVVYGAQNFLGGRGGSFDPVEPDLAALSTTGDQQSSFVSGVNYVRWDNITPDNSMSDQRIRLLVGNGPDGIGIFNGFELEAVAAPVPEPTCFAMLLAGGVGMILVRRRSLR